MSPMKAPPEAPADDGPLPIQEYRAVSVWAMAALGLGLLSGISVFSPLLGIVPLVALVIGGYALRQVNREGLAGRWMAVAPLVLAPLFLGWGCSREFSRREILVAALAIGAKLEHGTTIAPVGSGFQVREGRHEIPGRAPVLLPPLRGRVGVGALC